MYQDDRTDEQTTTHTFIVGGHDPWMSGWGQCPGHSFAYWAARPEDSRNVERWVRRSKDLKNVWVTTTKALRLKHPTRPAGRPSKKQVHQKSETDVNHTHVYVVEEGHPALLCARDGPID